MFDRLVDVLGSIWMDLLPWFVLDQYESGVLLHFGKFKCLVGPGFHWRVPFVDTYLECTVVTTTHNGPAQSVITSDSVDVVVSAIVKYRIDDVKVYLLEVTDVKDAISDITLSTCKREIAKRTWEKCKTEDLDGEITKTLRREAKKWGIAVDAVTLVDMARMRSIRLLIGETNRVIT
jgi:regulator of protease activity HflC (stomatin/prohibitin superfamily)